ncbi:unnamed protein product [Brassicogethes aeneus]|uniref:MADF domain-containing protein n=1 Tax=Brassicogethes aeneus TaxID=1431903 RepID=A0A9P0BH19_BRAAE|nr:unnamed protein product [Brassicogethes aeneus]
MDEAERIRVVQQFPYLYDKKHSLFKDKMDRENSWKTIFGLMNDHQQHEIFSAIDVEKRWTSLRQKYSQQKKEIRTMPSGSAGGVKVKWSFFDSMGFLEEFVHARKWLTTNGSKCCIKDVAPLADLWEPLPELWDSLGTITSDNVATTEVTESKIRKKWSLWQGPLMMPFVNKPVAYCICLSVTEPAVNITMRLVTNFRCDANHKTIA